MIGADDALKALRDSPVTAIHCRPLLEGTTGTDLAKEMKQIKPDIPIILFSGTEPQDLSCVDVYVRKGESTAELLGIVGDVVQTSYS
jgi:DNA-binding NtrC family response regulator